MRVIIFSKGGSEGIRKKDHWKDGVMLTCGSKSGRESKYDENGQWEIKNVGEEPRRSMPYQERFE